MGFSKFNARAGGRGGGEGGVTLQWTSTPSTPGGSINTSRDTSCYARNWRYGQAERPLGSYADCILPKIFRNYGGWGQFPGLSSSYTLMDQYYNSLLTNIAIWITLECPIIGEQVVIIFIA